MSTSLRPLHLLLLCFAFIPAPHKAWAWGEPHHAITRAALDVLPAWQKELLGTELTALSSTYCMIPDNVYTDKENAKYAAMEAHPGEVYLKKLHLPESDQTVNLESLRYFMGKAVNALKEGKTGDAARYMGTICHIVEDFGSPSHTIPGDNQFTLLQQFMPPTDKIKDTLLHGPIENGVFEVSIRDYQPQLLGVTEEEASWRLLHRVHEGIINARSTTLPIIQALYAGDDETKLAHQLRAATKDAQVLADALHTILCLGAGRFEPGAIEKSLRVNIASFWPVEAVNLYYPQSDFFSSPYWGHARSGSVLEGGKKAAPIKILIGKEGGVQEQVFANAISTGMGKPLTWHLPKGVYRRFIGYAGLQAGIGDKGRMEFSVVGDGKPLWTKIVNGGEPAAGFDCDITGVSQLQLRTEARGLDAKSNYAIWADPTVLKAARE